MRAQGHALTGATSFLVLPYELSRKHAYHRGKSPPPDQLRGLFSLNEKQSVFLIGVIALVLRVIFAYLNISRGGVAYNSQLETYNDFQGYYVQWLHDLSIGLLPYKDFFMQYPPLFLYGLYPSYWLGGAAGTAAVIVLADAASAALLYLILENKAGKRIALIAGLGYAFSPFGVLVEGYLLLSLQPMMFFLLVSILLAERKRPTASLAALGIAALFRQEALFIVPAFGLYFLRDYKSQIIRGTFLLLGILLAVSIPFLLTAPIQYLGTLAYHPPEYPLNASAGEAAQISVVSTLFTSGGCTPLQDGTRITLCTPTTLSLSGISLTGVLNWVFGVAYVPMGVLLLPVLYAWRNRSTFLEMTSAYSIAASYMIFNISGASYAPFTMIAWYPLLPFYAILLVAGTNWKTPLVAFGFAALSLIVPAGVVQLVLPFFALLGVMAVEDSSAKGKPIGPGAISGSPLAIPAAPQGFDVQTARGVIPVETSK